MINLLPSQFKEEISLEERKKIVIILGILSFLFLISLILILFAIKIYLNSQVEAQKAFFGLEMKEKESPEIKELENKIGSVNQRLSQLDNFYQKQLHFSEILEEVNKTIPKEIYLTSLSFSKDTSEVRLSGFSPTRETLVQFRKDLELSFQDVKVPPANWVEARDINFSGINFKAKK